MRFTVSNHPYASSIRTTHWFYKGWCIDCYSYDHYQLDLTNTQLTIINASENDIGRYEVRVTELNHYASDSAKCDPLTLEVLQHQAVLVPLLFHLSLTGNIVLSVNVNKLAIITIFNSENNASNNIANMKVLHYYGDINQALTINHEYEKPDLFRISRFFRFYSDGQLANYLTSSGGPFYGTNESHLMIHVPQYNESWAGDYTIVSYADCHDVVWTLLSECTFSDFFTCHDLRLRHILESVLQVTIATRGKNIMHLKKLLSLSSF